MKKLFFLIAVMLIAPQFAQAQYFKADVKDGIGLHTYLEPDPRTPKSKRGLISNQVNLLVDSVTNYGRQAVDSATGHRNEKLESE